MKEENLKETKERKMKKFQKQVKGITLIALVVTIIVLLILAGVAINLTIGNNGIFTRAQQAVDVSETATDIENLQMALVGSLRLDGTVDLVDFQANLPDGFEYAHGSYINTKNGKEYKINEDGEVTATSADLDLLEQFLLGEDKNSKKLSEVINLETYTFIPDEVMPNADKEIKIVALEVENAKNFGLITYKDKVYKVLIPLDVDLTEVKVESVELVYEPKGEEGKKVAYSYDGTEEKEWTILYDDGEYIEIISPDLLGIGFQVGENTSFRDGIEEYNNAVTNINKECERLVTNANKVSVRSVGSNPKDPDYINTKKIESDQLGEYSGMINAGDTSYVSDLARMCYHNITNVSGESYWLASCGSTRNNNFHVRQINENGQLVCNGVAICGKNEEGISKIKKIRCNSKIII